MRSPSSAPAFAVKRSRPILVTGGAGFIGCNLAHRLAAAGQHVLVLDSLRRPGVELNLSWLEREHPSRISKCIADVGSTAAADVIKDVGAVFHLAAQVAVTTSLENPAADFDTNLRATLDLLEAARRGNPVPFIFASTNKVYGNLADVELEAVQDAYRPVDADIRRNGISEARRLCFHTPYGCSKGAAEQYVLDYAHTFGLQTVVIRMSCIYGPRQLGTEDQGWVAHFLISALNGRPITIYGDGRQVRDVLYVEDAVEAYIRAWQSVGSIAGRAFNLGGGPSNAVSLRRVLRHVEALLGQPAKVEFASWRPGDQRYYVSDTRAITAALNLPAPRAYQRGLADLAGWLRQARARPRRRPDNRALAQARP
jgi:CDP-paratose 2-epimerase